MAPKGSKRKAPVDEAPADFAHKAPKIPQTPVEKEKATRVIVILEQAPLETGKVGEDFQLMAADDHQNILRKNGKEVADYRPDITHQCLLSLMDSPLNKAGKLQVYIHTQKNVLIEVNPHTRIPRTYKRFSKLFVQLLHKLSISAVDSSQKLLKVIKNPITDHLPTDCIKIGTSYNAKKVMSMSSYAKQAPAGKTIVFTVGAVAHGKVEPDYVDEEICCSEYPLSAALVCCKICTAFEELWNIL